MSSDRSDGGEPGQAAKDASPPESAEPKAIERSIRGRIVIRSSSHPPTAERQGLDAREHSGARPLPTAEVSPRAAETENDERPDARSKRATPAERPRRRRQIQAAQAERSRQDTPAARPVARKRRRGFDPLAEPRNDLVAHATHAQPSLAPGQVQDTNAGTANEIAGAGRPSSRRARIAVAIALFIVAVAWLLLRG